MITMDMVGKIRRLHSRGKKSEREISRITGLSRNTIAKWLKGSVAEAPRYRRNSPTSTVLVPTAAGRHHRLMECAPA
jgi:transcriptional regulator with XRE-family HTH domain